ncbi:MAG TPA: methylamine utilization protein [Gammaproteobacteria bacterium]
MRTKVLLGSAGLRLCSLLVALAPAAQSAAATLEVSVTDEQGRPVAHVAVYITAVNAAPEALRTPTAVMDQQDKQFLPHMLVVQTGTSVQFPNHDDVSHHVYSFSRAKSFELGLYKGQAYPPVVFDVAGTVVLGCNIHDGMLGYIKVVDTPHFALTNDEGVALIDGLPDAEYTLEVWTPRLRENALPAPRSLVVASGQAPPVAVQLTGRLAPEHSHGKSSLSWDRY